MADANRDRIGLAQVRGCSERMRNVLNQVKEAALQPGSTKKPPRRSTTQVASLLGLSKAQFQRRQASGTFPSGQRSGSSNWFLLEEVRDMARTCGLRDPGAEGHGIVLTIANFKGGVAKTSTTVTLAQFLAERGYNVLVIDLDPQASATTLFGLSPYLDVTQEHSAYAFFGDETVDVASLARKTYWPGIDIIPSNQYLYQREFALAAAGRDWGGEIFEYLQQFMPDLKAKYDVILIDTQPSLGFLTSTGVFASDHLLVTVPPSNLDFASSAIFWDLLADILQVAASHDGHPKYWESIQILLTREDAQDKSTTFVRGLLAMGCGSWLLQDSVPTTRVMTNASSDFNTVYDIEHYEGSLRSIKRARELFDKAYTPILESLRNTWNAWQQPGDHDLSVAQKVAQPIADRATSEDSEAAMPHALASSDTPPKDRVA